MLDSAIEIIREINIFSLMLRAILSLISGTLIGMDRSVKHRGAGIKTHVLVCLGSALTMCTGQYINTYFGSGMDVSRIGAQVISGVGFLGVGTIIVTGRNQIRGLTTAAGLWTCACIGLAFGIGFYEGGLIISGFVWFTFSVLSKVDNYVYERSPKLELYVETKTRQDVSALIKSLRERNIRVSDYGISKNKMRGDSGIAVISIELKDANQKETIIEDIRDMDGVRYVEGI